MKWPKDRSDDDAWIAAYTDAFRSYDEVRLKRAKNLLLSYGDDVSDELTRATRRQLAAIARLESERR
jgi:hypothetical protein